MASNIGNNKQKRISPKTSSYRTFVGKAGSVGKYAGGGLTIALEVGIGYMEDTAADRSTSKIASNAGVNAGYAVLGLGVSAFATPFVASGIAGFFGMAAVTGPVGLIAAGVVGLVWGLITVASSDLVKNAFNSLE